MNGTDRYGVSGRIADFDKRNGGNPVYFNQWFLYANGARRESMPMGALIEPPDDEYQLARNILEYHQGRHAEAVRNFENLKERLGMSGCPDREGLDELKKLFRVVGERNQSVNDAQARLAKTETGKRLAAGRQMNAEHQQEMKDYRNQLRAMRI
jgi:hypothetical protein